MDAADDQEQCSDQRRVDERQDRNDHLVAREREHFGGQLRELLHEFDEQRDNREQQPDEERREQPAAAKYPMLERRFDFVHGSPL